MITSTKQKEQKNQLNTKLWSIANDLRGNMEHNEFKNYILGVIFYRYLSEKLENRVSNLLKEDNITYAEAWNDEEYTEELKEELLDEIGYYIAPEYLFSTMVNKITNTKDFTIEELSKAIGSINESTLGTKSQDAFENLFDDLDLESNKLGQKVEARSKLMAKVLSKIAEIDFSHEDSEIDVLGDAYEFLISQFASSAGKKAGEFYTPQQVSKILAKIVTMGKKDLKSVYDPTCGSGSLLLRISKEADVRKFYGQEVISTTYNLARMNMLLHNVSYDKFDIQNDDVLENPKHLGKKFDAVVANPPYSQTWDNSMHNDDDRFSEYGKMAPNSKADFAFVQHMIYHLADKGVMAVVLPHGVLFRGNAEGTIRKYLIKEKNYLDAVIGLPSNIFFGTGIPTTILVFKKCRETGDNVLFIDASNDYEPGKNQNILRDEDVEKIIDTYKERKAIDKYSAVATLDDIKENDYNLNIPRYVDTFEEEEPVNMEKVKAEIKELKEQFLKQDEDLEKILNELEL
ncbi:type I restriction-modification system subunit M [Methanococcus voltae]|uniref:site-specific DNA-methyltransferase (adenine-specific) n=1 Tax=Methanococcus voltae (strain ATCC BAA-1334 / A3) TaxID=456320 RepID=D7DS68_METV3|nr:type I restriction-modification system subunit M [Methanococcus voltae]MCS3901504.1 type I restriction enzyme M protein [Methanococcus voltae]